ncbi:MAG: GNAT family N-acetyltransferase [Candidatus Dormiibacterota bacterium]
MDIRAYRQADEDAVVQLSLRAWAPVFDSMEDVLGAEISARLHGADWREYQAMAVRDTLGNPAVRTWVAGTAGRIAGFVAATIVDRKRLLGEVTMLAVDPVGQNQGIGTALTEHATGWLRDAGMRVAMIGTGGDPGHAPARHVYEKENYRPLPLARYFKAL